MKRPAHRLKALKAAGTPHAPPAAPAPAMSPIGIRRAAIATRSGLSRYPREVYHSIRDARAEAPVVIPALDLADFESHPLAALWIGHATVLLRVGGMTLLTDPVFSSRVGLSLGGLTLGVRRVIPPAVDVEHLPEIDAVLLSHAHFDHFDRPSLRRLMDGPARHATIVTAANTRRLVPRPRTRVIELAWDTAAEIEGRNGGLTIAALRPNHWGARTALDRHRRFNSYLLNNDAARVLFAGDSAHTDAFRALGPVDLSIFGIGAYDPWEHAHATPEQVWAMYLDMGRGRPHGSLLPMHHSTFVLGREPLDEPLRRLIAAAGVHTNRLVAFRPGMFWPDPTTRATTLLP